eukprot:CAMPEP_0168422990 /NCGR_PEP_ID=MMETSP0228-20121227/34077_1 /TAXON_ID=133427 /ORGANISM="Protoceratium reticulatum, Strain CCCM 535 (=CCMP 1889)" /LENGTH=155 /DNA_ID=CAMNT_0008436937 /DNA_START=182 /DNA_END=649 /DNA_ORIENTATION=+
MCSKGIDGQCAQSSQGLVCLPCKEGLEAQLRQFKELFEKGDVNGANELGKALEAKGFKPPPAQLDGKCSMCSKTLGEECDQTAKGYICKDCGNKVAEQVKQMAELFHKGDPMGAALMGKRLKEYGVVPPSIESMKHGVPSILRASQQEQDSTAGR